MISANGLPEALSARTVMVHVAVSPFTVFAVTVTLPAAHTLTTPLFTLPTFLSLMVQVNVFSVVSLGVNVGVSVSEFPKYMVAEVLFSLIAVGFTITLTAQLLERPFTVFAVIEQEPVLMAFTLPFASTVATAVLLLVHVTDLSFALSGTTFTPICWVFPFSRVKLS